MNIYFKKKAYVILLKKLIVQMSQNYCVYIINTMST